MKVLELMSKLRKIHVRHGNLPVDVQTLNGLISLEITELNVEITGGKQGAKIHIAGPIKYTIEGEADEV